MNKLPYSELAPTLKTGDIVLFSGRYSMSKLVEKLEGSIWSHVAMVVRLDEFDFPLLYEATALTNLPDVLTGKSITGPKVVNLKDRLDTYGQDVTPYEAPTYSIRRCSKTATTKDQKIILNILQELSGRPNPGEWEMIFNVLVGRYLYIPTSMKTVTCSEFIAYTLRRLHRLGGLKPINGFMPKDFSTDGKLKLINDTSFGDEIIIELDK